MREPENTDLSFLNLLQEFRAVGEFARFAGNAWTWRWSRRAAHSRSILLIPGFMAGDATLYPFANWLRSLGHEVFFSGILANADCPRRVIDRLTKLVIERYERAGEKLVVIGHSLGGIYARELGRRLPECIEQIILLGSPIKDPHKHSNPYVKILALMTQRIHQTGGCKCELANICGVNADEAPEIPETLIYSKSDGVVDWASCIEEGRNVSAFEVKSTHCGLPYNLETLRIVREQIEHVPPPL
ncbi:MAG TPA: alpha/beta hydrolase [Candidatus Binataceae bacterium]|nr:alpha/beta hydrolase [Candidatus Binataceae bacterium]